MQENVGKVLGISSRWWGDVDTEFMFNDAEEDDDDEGLDRSDVYVRVPSYEEPGLQLIVISRRRLRTTHLCWSSRRTHYQISFNP